MMALRNRATRPIDWTNTLFLTLTPFIALALGIYVVSTEGMTPFYIWLFFGMYFLTGLSVTVGYHRLFSHKAYKASPLLETVLLIFGAATFQNSALKWCSDHRRHHRHCDDNEVDPYSINKGFFYAHIGWVFLKEDKAFANKYPKDLLNNPRVMWQHRYYLPIALLVSFGLPGLIGHFFGSALGGLAFGGFIRIVVVHHATFCINSLCHMLGTQPYSDKNTAKDSPIMALFTYGEGYHNFHHFFQSDYRNGTKWYHFDPSKWLIWALAQLGQAKHLKKTPKEKILQARLNMQHKRICRKNLSVLNRQRVQALKDKLDTLLTKIQYQRKEALQNFNDARVENKRLIRNLKNELNAALHEWSLMASI